MNNFFEVINPDIIGSWLLVGGSIIIIMNIYRAYVDKSVKGVNPITALFFALINVYYTGFYYYNDHIWSMVGSLALTITQVIWWGQMIYYTKLEKNK